MNTSLNFYLKQAQALGATAEKSMSWFDSHEMIRDDLDRAFCGYNELPSAIPIFGGSGDKFTMVEPWHHIFYEAEQDLDSAILLLLMGFYKDSFRSIRSFLELNVFAFYHFINKDEGDFEKWISGQARTPELAILLKALNEKNDSFRALNELLKWNEQLGVLYVELSGFVHTRGALHTHTSLKNSNQVVFSETGMQIGSSLLLRAVRLAGMGFAVNFPMSFQALPRFDKFAFNGPAGGFLSEDQVKRISAIFPESVAKVISEICLSNKEASSLADGIRSMPDLTEQEVFESFNKTLQSKEFSEIRNEILKMMERGEINKAFSLMEAAQRAQMRAITGVLFNPFYGEMAKTETPQTRRDDDPRECL